MTRHFPGDDLREVPAGRSWFHSIRVGMSVTIIEHRVSAKVFGGEAEPSKAEYVTRHEGLTHAEGVRLKRRLGDEGLIYAGGPL